MAYWQVRVPYEGIASIVMESDNEPKFDEFRSLFHTGQFTRGIPQYYTMKAEIDEIDRRQYDNISRLVKRKASINKIAEEILKSNVS